MYLKSDIKVSALKLAVKLYPMQIFDLSFTLGLVLKIYFLEKPKIVIRRSRNKSLVSNFSRIPTIFFKFYDWNSLEPFCLGVAANLS